MKSLDNGVPQKAERVRELPNSCSLYRMPNGAGGYTYWSDEVGDGVMVWDTCLVNEGTMLTALAEENTRRFREQYEKRKKEMKEVVEGVAEKAAKIEDKAFLDALKGNGG